MKLRLRSLESKETLRIEVPDSCTIQNLKNSLIRSHPFSSSSTLRLSLNRKDDIQASSPEDSLRSLGITSGDLIFYTFSPSGFSSPNEVSEALLKLPSPPCLPVNFDALEEVFRGGRFDFKKPKIKHSEILGVGGLGEIDEGEEKLDSDSEVDEVEKVLNMELDLDSGECESIEVVKKRCSKPVFLKRVLQEGLGFDRNAHKLLVTAVHAVLLESGFVLIDPNSTGECTFCMPEDWPSSLFTMSLWYTLPELLVEGRKNYSLTGIVLLKFQSLGQFVNVYGSIGCSRGSCVYHVCLDGKELAPILDMIWADSESGNMMYVTEACLEKRVFEFWKVVKDAVALPLLIDLCEKTGLPAPASFMLLPGDLKLKILEALPGVDIGRVECVCSELRDLASSNDLWKLKLDEEFKCSKMLKGSEHWKARYIACVEGKKFNNRVNSRLRFPILRGTRRSTTSGELPRIYRQFLGEFTFGNPGPVYNQISRGRSFQLDRDLC